MAETSGTPAELEKSVAPELQKGFWPELGNSFRQRTGTYIVTAVFAILTVFSDNIAGRIKAALNRADTREEKYATLSRELSGYIFDCELVQEYLANGWTTKEGLTPIILDYNKDITNLRRNEYANRAVLKKYWNKDRQAEFVVIMKDVLTIDSAFHKLNDEFEKVNVLGTEERVDPARAKAAASELQGILTGLTAHVEELLDKLA